MDFESFARDLSAPARLPAALDLVTVERVDSTNLLARRLVDGTQNRTRPLLLVAWEQSAGRGRRGRQWVSAAGRGAWATLVWRFPNARAAATLPLLAPVALCEALDAPLGGRCRVKWPNDLVVGGRKLGGVLVELLGGTRPFALIGFGVNHSFENEPPTSTATSLADELSTGVELAEIVGRLTTALVTALERADEQRTIVERFRRWSVHRPGEHVVCRTEEGVIEGRFLGFDGRGFLRLGRRGGETVLASAELVGENG